MEQHYREHLPLLPGAVEVVRALRRRWPLALASSANREFIDFALDAAGLAAISRDGLLRGGRARQARARRLPRGGAPARGPGGWLRRDRGLEQRHALGGGRRHDSDRDAEPALPTATTRSRSPGRRAHARRDQPALVERLREWPAAFAAARLAHVKDRATGNRRDQRIGVGLEHRVRRPRGGPDGRKASQRLVNQRLERLIVTEWRDPADREPGGGRASSALAARSPSRFAATRRSPAHSTITGSSSRMNTSDLTIWPTSHPTATAASGAVRAESGSITTDTSRPCSCRRSWNLAAVGCTRSTA